MEPKSLCIGRSGSWDGMTYPRVSRWPLSADEERNLLARYVNLLIMAFSTYDLWVQNWRRRSLDDYYFGVELMAESLPAKVYVVLSFCPQKITWPGEFYPYRLEIGLAWCSEREATPAFASHEEASIFAQGLAKVRPYNRYAVAELAVID